jgi:hypothetical protein
MAELAGRWPSELVDGRVSYWMTKRTSGWQNELMDGKIWPWGRLSL